MSVFEHSFSLIGLVLGLALVEVLGSLIRTMKQRHTIKIGWLTPMLATFIVLDTTTFWGIVYENRELLTSIWPTLGLGVVLSSAYYAAASMAFPDRQDEWTDLDAYFMHTKQFILGVLLTTYLVVIVAQAFIGRTFSVTTNALNATYCALLLVTALVPSRKLCMVGLIGLIAVDVCAFVT